MYKKSLLVLQNTNKLFIIKKWRIYIKITATQTGYGLSLAMLLIQHKEVKVVCSIKKKIDMLNNKKSSIQDGETERNLKATLDGEYAYKDTNYVIIVAHKELVAMQPGDVPITYADTTPLERDFEFKPSTSLKEGIKAFAKWYKEFYID